MELAPPTAITAFLRVRIAYALSFTANPASHEISGALCNVLVRNPKNPQHYDSNSFYAPRANSIKEVESILGDLPPGICVRIDALATPSPQVWQDVLAARDGWRVEQEVDIIMEATWTTTDVSQWAIEIPPQGYALHRATASPLDQTAIMSLGVSFGSVEPLDWLRKRTAAMLGEAPGHTVFLTRDESGEAGFHVAFFRLALSEVDEHALLAIMVVTGERHRRRGVASWALRSALAEMVRDSGPGVTTRVFLEVDPENGGARELYLKLGFRSLGLVKSCKMIPIGL
ncbi:hypothetical protein M427DRAFT_57366 [Gonapodya prolifera JEL478]|uniref:N-acetyltransferase domain-containing protein n=1 Tax=Gonapodya prolifera (strain JEL478) TaxID=1344416 RepID=A0A139AD56_GONPJ|nr:hypothetical protein M427DRAFT_57366 [Gonapodya prolifera JEL478]|eukprot:KXS14707.1 hypothetical protein M427DRAFT_57366 [Gonapodya prolifera JEL478]